MTKFLIDYFQIGNKNGILDYSPLMTNYITRIQKQYADCDEWHQKYPWFSIGHLIESTKKKHSPDSLQAIQSAAIYFNDIHRLHFLLNSDLIEKDFITDDNITIEGPHPQMSSILAEASKKLNESTPDAEELPLISEPYHTIDYFASQGIKLDAEPRADDKFGQQLKSFTSWLKQMKRLPAAEIAAKEPDPIIEEIAAQSIMEKDTITEPMVEVLLKQGRKTQAIVVLEKLRLLYPEKSHYFATRIEEIKL